MKKNIIVIVAIITTITSVAQNRKINFEHVSFTELKQLALKQNKLIFIDAFTTWCGPCKHMAKTVFTNDTVADYYNQNFINAKIDMEKGEGIELAKQYNVNCYPNLLFIDGNGNLVHRVAGSMLAADFINFAKDTKTPEKTFAYYKLNYDLQKNNSDFLSKYISLQSNTCIEPNEAVSQYFLLQKEDDLISEKNWAMIKEQTTSIDSKEYAYLTKNKNKFELLYGKNDVLSKIDNIHSQTLIAIIKEKPFNEKKYSITKNKIKETNIGNTTQLIFESDLKLAQKNKNWKTYADLAIANVDTYYLKNSNELNSIAWVFYESVTDNISLLKAELWSKKSTELDENYGNLDTYACLLYKIGKKNEALAAANKAIDFAKKEGASENDYKETSNLLEKIKALK